MGSGIKIEYLQNVYKQNSVQLTDNNSNGVITYRINDT